ncbi:MAG: polyhydroxyalkanoic acid system family protein [Pseudomonadota bacterium]
MSDIVIRRTHGLSAQQARDAAESIAAKLQQEFDLRYQWDGDVLRFKRSGVSGELQVEPREVEIRVRLGFLLAALRPRVEQEIHKFFDDSFGKSGKARV